MRRILDLTVRPPAEGLALDESLLRCVGSGAGAESVFRAWIDDRAVVVGRSQRASEEANLERCAREGIPVISRISGGGAVVHHPGNLNLTLVHPRPSSIGTVAAVYERFGSVVTGALGRLGIPVVSRGNDLLSPTGAKVGGAAQARRRGLLWHSTLLLFADRIPMEQLLSALQPGYAPSRVASRPSPTTTLDALAPSLPSPEEIARSIGSAFAEALGEPLRSSDYTEEERQWARLRRAALEERSS